MIYKLYQRLLHKLRAHTRHGIHSPFVYRFIDDGLQSQLPAEALPALPLRFPHAATLYRILAFFRPEQVWIFCDDTENASIRSIAASAGAAYAGPPRETTGAVCDALIVCASFHAEEIMQRYRTSLHLRSLVIMTGLYESRAATQQWNKVKTLQSVRMSIDLFHFGILLFRKEFLKPQEFRLRT